MSLEAFDQYLKTSLHRLDALLQQVDRLPDSASTLWRQAEEFPEQKPQILQESLEELSSALEELHVVIEELRSQNQTLFNSQSVADTERAYYQELFELAPYAYLITDSNGCILLANRKAGELFGVPAAKLKGKPLKVFVSAEESPIFFDKLKQLKQDPQEQTWEIAFQGRDRRVLRCLCQIYPTQDVTGQFTARWGLQTMASPPGNCQPLCEAASMPTALRQPPSLPAHFATIVSHDLRNPINNIYVCIQMLQKSLSNSIDGRQELYLRQVRQNIQRTLQILDNLQLIAQIATDRPITPALIDLTIFCQQLIESLQQEQGYSHPIVFQAGGQYCGLCDRTLLQIILTNLLLNAMKYSAEGSDIHLELGQVGDRLLMTVRDRGVGIAPQEWEHLFEAFYRGSNSRGTTGSGLGLAIVKSAVAALGGEIQVESESGVGSTFKVFLPLQFAPSPRDAEPLAKIHPKSTNHSKQPPEPQS
ncbi:MAG: PAS domain-containing protein [Chloroflexaceae bacterium]|nr:PAS domain-containing protein [Chloroflexaceae bacterium]